MTMVRHDSSNNQPLSSSTSIPGAMMDGTTKRRRRQLSLPKASLSRFFSTKNTTNHKSAATMADVDESSALQMAPTTKKHEAQLLSLTQQQLQDDMELVKQQQMLSMKEDKQLLSSFVKRRIRQASMPMSSTLSRFFDTTTASTATAITRGEQSETTRKDKNTGTGTDHDNTLAAVATAAAAADPKECVKTTRVPNKKKGQQLSRASQHTVRFSTHDNDDDPMVGEPHCVFYEPRKSYECPTHMSTLWYTQWNLNQVAAERTQTVEIMCPNGVEPLPDNPLYCLRGLEIQYSKALAEQRYFQRQFFKAVVFNEQAVERQRLRQRQRLQQQPQPQPQPQKKATETTAATVVVDNSTTTADDAAVIVTQTAADDDDANHDTVQQLIIHHSDDDDEEPALERSCSASSRVGVDAAATFDLPAQIYQQAQAYSGTALQQAQQRAIQDAQEAALYQREVVVVAQPTKVWWKKTSKKHRK